MSGVQDLYHYTSMAAAELIKRDKCIRKSTCTKTDAVLGEGVYLTDLSTSTDDDVLLANNYGRVTASMKSKIEVCFRIPAADLPGFRRKRLGSRVIYLYPDDIDLENVHYELCKKDKNGGWGEWGDWITIGLLVGGALVLGGLLARWLGGSEKEKEKTASGVQDLYHYTSMAAAELIKRDKCIRKSTCTKTDAVLGEGVYLTDLSTSTDDDVLLANNYGRMTPSIKSKIEVCFRIPAADLPGLRRKRLGSRVIYLYPDDIDLENVHYKLCKKDKNGGWGEWGDWITIGLLVGGALVLGGLLARWLGGSEKEKEKTASG